MIKAYEHSKMGTSISKRMTIDLSANHKDLHESTTQARCNAPDYLSAPLCRWPTGISTALRVVRILSLGVPIFHTMPRLMTPIQFWKLLQMHADPQNVTSCFPMRRAELRQMQCIGPSPLSLRVFATSGSEAHTPPPSAALEIEMSNFRWTRAFITSSMSYLF